MQPKIIKYNEIDKLKNQQPGLIIHDEMECVANELFDIVYPAKKDSKSDEDVYAYAATLFGSDKNHWGEWVHYPWLNQIVHFPPKDSLRALRTSRNRNLVTIEEQAKLYASTIMIVGMSVGSNIVEALVSQGIGQKLILIDMDIIEPSNLNRIRSPFSHVGLHKVEAISRKVWEIDPFIEIVDYKDGLNTQNLPEILLTHKPDVVVDEMDDLKMKILLRQKAKEFGLPVVMAADDGDDTLVDIERYDQNPALDLFNGNIPQEILDKIKNHKINRAETGMLIGRYFIGPENIPLRMFQSLAEVGRSLPSWPQLGVAASLAGLSISFIIKRILLGQPLQDGKVLVSINKALGLDHLDPEYQSQLDTYRNQLRKFIA
jgi:molybdopterin/thiamine biosynthesis adenylyltransferase